MKISRRALAVQPSATLAISAKAKALAARGEDIVSLSAGEPDFATPEHVRRAIAQALEAGFTRYTATAGAPELREAIARKLARENGLRYAQNELLATVGAKHALYNFFQATLDEGDEVLIPSPCWVSYPDMVTLAGGKPVLVPTDAANGFILDPKALAARLTERTVAVVLNSPSNPTGALYGRATLEGIAQTLRGHSCFVVSDDIYEHLIYTGEPFVNLLNVAPDLRDRTLVVNGLSKSFSMTGLRIGYAAGPATLIGAMQRIQDQSTSNPTSIIQKGAIAALDGPLSFVEEMRAAFSERRRYVQERLRSIDGVSCPEIAGAFYAFPDFRSLCARSFRGEELDGRSARLAEILLESFGVAVVPGAPFGAEGFLRLSFATSMAQLEKGLDRITACAAQLG